MPVAHFEVVTRREFANEGEASEHCLHAAQSGFGLFARGQGGSKIDDHCASIKRRHFLLEPVSDSPVPGYGGLSETVPAHGRLTESAQLA
jgi:hypothetical protein